MIFQVYTLLYYIITGILFPKEFFKRSSPLRRKWLRNKWGLFERKKWFPHQKLIWIHAVSVGEVMGISKLIEKLSQKYNLLISTITDTGQKVALEKFKNLPVEVIYLPFDCPFAIKRTLKAFNPSALLITETEIWPNLILTTSKRIPVFLINARLSDKSFKKYKVIKFFIAPLIKNFSLIATQDEEYKKKFEALGAISEKIVVVGNTKFDIDIPFISFSWENLISKPVVIAGSTHFPEEKLISEVFLKIPYSGSLFIAPRHPERYIEVENTIKELIKNKKKVLFYKLSEISNPDFTEDISRFFKLIILVDQIGILAPLYRICDIAIIGGSFIPHGGQNPLEAIYWKKPVIFGPFMENFPFVKEFLEKKACIQTSLDNLANILETFIKDENLRMEMGEKAYKLLEEKRGATDKILELISLYL